MNLTDRVKEAVGHIRKARDLMANGPLDYYLEKLAEHSEALLTKFSPIKEGEKAVIVKEIRCENGWRNCHKTLAVGAIGTVRDVDYDRGRFVFGFLPDKEWWADHEGNWHEAKNPHIYHLTEDQITALKN